MFLKNIRGYISLLLFLIILTPQVNAQSNNGIMMELNTAQTHEEKCRVDFVFRNSLANKVNDMTVELVLFKKSGQIANFLMIQTGALAKGKTLVKRYDFEGTPCDDLSRILVNSVKSCEGGDNTPEKCLAALNPSSLTRINLDF